MPVRPSKGLKGVYVELPPEVIDQAKSFADGRGESFREVVLSALRRHMAYPPPLVPPPPPVPPPPLPPPAPFPNGVRSSRAKTKGKR